MPSSGTFLDSLQTLSTYFVPPAKSKVVDAY